ncbi:MAG: cobaltochelatase subunit CobN, partial [Nocardioides sp.]
MARILLLSTSDTDLLSARSGTADYRLANPARLDVEADLPALLDGADLVVLRILGSARSWQSGLDALQATGLPLVVLGGEQTPDAELMRHSTVPVGTAAEAHRYLAEGGPANLEHLHAFLSDTVLLTGDGFEPPQALPTWGLLERESTLTTSPRVGILCYRAHVASGNDLFVHDLADAVEAAGATAVPVYCASLRGAPQDLLDELGTLDALVVTVLAAGGTKPANASAGGDDEAWDVAQLAALDIPVLQGLCLTWDRASWEASDDGVSPLDAATQVAVPEFDGRLVTVAFSFKEIDGDGLPRYVTDPERCARVAGIAVAHARLRHVPPAERKVALVLSAYPTKHSRVGNAVGLDTPVSAVRLLRRLRDEGYDLGDGALPGLDEDAYDDDPTGTKAGNALIHALIDAGGQDEDWLTAEQLSGSPVRISAATYRRWTAHLPAALTGAMAEAWGEAPGDLYVDRSSDLEGEIVLATLQAGNVVILIQPPRGFGDNPVAIYHDPDLPPPHHYLAAYRWLENAAEDGGFGADAVVHLGKHGSLEWLPGKGVALSAACATDAALGNLPMVYPFLVNDPGEGAQAKRRAHATIVDHLIPPMARAEAYGDIARLEQLLDEHANIAAMDPAKLPAVRAQIWTLIQAARMDHDLGLDSRPADQEFDDFILHVDGWLCEVKDAQIRDGLHVLGQAPEGETRVNLVLAVLRAAQVWGGRSHAVPGLRTALGLDRRSRSERSERHEAPATVEVDRVEAEARAL